MSKSFLIKFTAFFMVLVFVFTLAPLGAFSVTALAEEMPEYNPEYGSFSEKNVNGSTVLTATANYGCGFRAWYDKSGNEVCYTSEFTLPHGKSADDYIPVFYNYNLVKNGGFEEYASGTSLKSGVPEDEIWEGTCDGELDGGKDFTTAKVTSARARSGKNSLAAFSHSNTTYHDFYGLEPNTQYTLKCGFNLDPNVLATDTTLAISRYMDFVAVLGEDMDMTVRANSGNAEYLACKDFDATSGATAADEWKEVKITFYTGSNTKVRLAFIYYSVYSDGKPVGTNIYIDDLSLVKDFMASPDYYNETFDASVQNWKANDLNKLSISKANGGRLKVTPKLTFGHISSPVLKVKKGAKYNISFDLDLSEVTMPLVPDVKDGKLLTDSSQVTEDNPEGYYWYVHTYNADGSPNYAANWININLSTNTKNYEGDVYYIASTAGVPSTQHWKITDANGKVYDFGENKGSSNAGFGKHTTLSAYDCSKPLKVNISFTAHKTDEIYLNCRLNGLGSYYIDNVLITQDISDVDYSDIVLGNALKTMGTAIRTEGKQGMRYKTELDKRLLAADKYYGIRLTEYGTIAIKNCYLGNEELVLNGEYYYNGTDYGVKKGVAYSFNEKIDKVYAENKDNLHFTGVLMNIAQKYWNEDYTARAYFKYIDANGKEEILYLDQSDIAVYPVAKAAYSARNGKNEFAEGEAVREYLYNNIIKKFTDKIIKVGDASKPVSSNFQGIRSTVYHGTLFFPDSHGRTYTEAQAAVEMDRLVDSKVDNVRTRLASQWMWKNNYGWDWDSVKMTAFYKWAKMLQDRDISITLNASWHMSDFMGFYNYKTNPSTSIASAHSSIPEVSYLHGYNDSRVFIDDLYGEDAKAKALANKGREIGIELTDDEFAHYSVCAVRYGEWIKQAVLSFKAHGINSVEYIIPFTETGYLKKGDPTYSYDEWTFMVMGLHDAFKEAGIRDDYKFIGPSQSNNVLQNREVEFVEYIYEKIRGSQYEDMIDIVAMHQYTSPNPEQGYPNTIYDPYSSYSKPAQNFPYFKDICENAGVSDKEFWCDEYFAYSPDAKWWNNVGMQMTQFAAGLTAGINTGVNRFLTWQIFDTLWDGEATHGTAIIDNSSEFSGGIHAVGTCPSLVHVDGKTCPKGDSCPCTANYTISSYLPRTTYYGINLIGRFMNNENADVLATEVIDEAINDGGGVYVSAIKNDDGNTVILVVNTMPTTSSVDIQLENAEYSDFARYTYNPNEIIPTVEAKPIQSDKKISLDGANAFYDVIPAQSFSIYVALGKIIGDDVDMDIPDSFFDEIA